ncbi:MAG: hypothetical protein WC916_05330 [Candidatus Woesearchaeota archaeon]
MSMMYIEEYVKDQGIIFYVDSDINIGLDILRSVSFEVISHRDLAYARIQKGINSSLSKYCSFVKEGTIINPEKPYRGRIWVRESLIFKELERVSYANSMCNDYQIKTIFPHFDIARYIECIPSTDYFIVNSKCDVGDINIPTNKFGEDERTVWLFQDQAKEYGYFLKSEAKMSEGTIHFSDSFSTPIFGVQTLISADYGHYLLHEISSPKGRTRVLRSDIGEYALLAQELVKNALHKVGICGNLEKRILSKINA